MNIEHYTDTSSYLTQHKKTNCLPSTSKPSVYLGLILYLKLNFKNIQCVVLSGYFPIGAIFR